MENGHDPVTSKPILTFFCWMYSIFLLVRQNQEMTPTVKNESGCKLKSDNLRSSVSCQTEAVVFLISLLTLTDQSYFDRSAAKRRHRKALYNGITLIAELRKSD